MPALPAPGRTGVRTSGDHYQWLVAWLGCVRLLRDDSIRAVPNPLREIGIELDAAGNLDDVVLLRESPPHTYTQVKYTVDATTPVNENYLLYASRPRADSILRRIAATWKELTATGEPVELVLLTNRSIDPTDPLLSGRDSRTGLLLPKAAEKTDQSALGRARKRWAANAALTENELLELLHVLRFDTGRDPAHLEEIIGLEMAAAGLRYDAAAVEQAVAWIARQVRNGQRRLSADAVVTGVNELGLAAGPVRAVLSVATLKPDPMREKADHALDWVDRFDGSSAYLKRRPLLPATWAQLQHEIEAIPARLPRRTHAVLVTGSLRQATAFAVGSALRMVTGVDVAVDQRGQLWSSEAHYPAAVEPSVHQHELRQGDDLAIAVAVATDPTDEVLEFLVSRKLPVDRLLVLGPPAGARDNALGDATDALGLVVGIRDLVRKQVRARTHAPRVHLFLAGPMGLALLLGHRWNRVRPTTVYEDVQSDDFYDAAFTIDA